MLKDFETNDVIGIGTESFTITNIDEQFSRLFVNRENYVGAAMTHGVGTNNIILKPTKFTFPVGHLYCDEIHF